MVHKTKLKFLLCFFFLIPVISYGQVRLPELISDGMVLQRNANVKIWGRASGGEKITIIFIDSAYRTTANKNGNWEVMLSDLKAGGPYLMKINGKNSITINNIVVGDVWVCSGQSNMGLMLGWLNNYQDEIKNSENPFIRQFLVPMGHDFNIREEDYKSGSWKIADPENVRRFTAVGYFFAKYIYEKYKVPVGLINASLGGSSAEAWISEEAIKSFPKYYEELQRFKDPAYLEKINKQDDKRVADWNKQLRQNDEGYKNLQQTWFDPGLNTSDWDTTHIPGYWTETKLGSINGVAWFRKEVKIPTYMAGEPAVVKLGRILTVILFLSTENL